MAVRRRSAPAQQRARARLPTTAPGSAARWPPAPRNSPAAARRRAAGHFTITPAPLAERLAAKRRWSAAPRPVRAHLRIVAPELVAPWVGRLSYPAQTLPLAAARSLVKALQSAEVTAVKRFSIVARLAETRASLLTVARPAVPTA